MWEDCAAPQVALAEPSSAAGSVSSEGHVFRCLKPLATGTIDLTA